MKEFYKKLARDIVDSNMVIRSRFASVGRDQLAVGNCRYSVYDDVRKRQYSYVGVNTAILKWDYINYREMKNDRS